MNLILTPNGYIPVDEPAIVTTQSAYNALSAEQKKNGVYYITDDAGKPITETIGVTDISSYGKDITTAISNIGAAANSKISTSNISYNLSTANTGFVLAANQGKILNDRASANTFTKSDIKALANKQKYEFTSDGYVVMLLTYHTNQYVYAYIYGKTGADTVPIFLVTPGSGATNTGTVSQTVFVRKGMQIQISTYADAAYANLKVEFYAMSY